MAVTEIAILHATNGTVTDELRQRLADASRIQEQWLARNFPGSPSTHDGRGDACFQQVEDPAKFLITARWHRQWIASEENKNAIDGIRDHIATEGEDKTDLSHVDGAVFAAPPPDGVTRLLDAPIVSVGRTVVPSENRAAAEAKNRRDHRRAEGVCAAARHALGLGGGQEGGRQGGVRHRRRLGDGRGARLLQGVPRLRKVAGVHGIRGLDRIRALQEIFVDGKKLCQATKKIIFLVVGRNARSAVQCTRFRYMSAS